MLSPYTVTKYKVILCAVPNYTIPLLIFPKCKLENSVKVPEEDKIAKLEESSVCQKKKQKEKKNTSLISQDTICYHILVEWQF